MKARTRIIILFTSFFLPIATNAQKQNVSLSPFIREFSKGYQALNIPALEYDYKKYFGQIPDTANLDKQEEFFKKEQKELGQYNYDALKFRDKLHYDQLNYEFAYNLQRISLEKQWIVDGRVIPSGGLSALKNGKDWYEFFIKRFTSLDISPEEVYKLGLSETERVQKEIRRIQGELGFADSAKFYKYLQSDTFLLSNKRDILARYARIDSTVRSNLDKFIDVKNIPPVYVIEWPNADRFTPPGMYLNRVDNSYNRDVFEFNFFGSRHNVRAMEWLYMHEAIPGHHLQFTELSRGSQDDTVLQQLFIYPGNFEGWACYVEYFGKDLGLYKNPYSELGKWEWDLVRSVRVVLDVGIHYYGWDYNKALAYWQANIPGQDVIAEREITRITNWPGQVLSYKVGAHKIMEMQKQYAEKQRINYNARKFRTRFIVLGMVPLAIIEKYMLT